MLTSNQRQPTSEQAEAAATLNAKQVLHSSTWPGTRTSTCDTVLNTSREHCRRPSHSRLATCQISSASSFIHADQASALPIADHYSTAVDPSAWPSHGYHQSQHAEHPTAPHQASGAQTKRTRPPQAMHISSSTIAENIKQQLRGQPATRESVCIALQTTRPHELFTRLKRNRDGYKSSQSNQRSIISAARATQDQLAAVGPQSSARHH